MGIRLYEHKSISIRFIGDEKQQSEKDGGLTIDHSQFQLFQAVVSKRFNTSTHCFVYKRKESDFELKADYCIGLDWLGKTGRYLYVEPKINSKYAQLFNQKSESDPEDDNWRTSLKTNDNSVFELDYLRMLLQVTSISESNEEIKDLVQIDWLSQPIRINQKDDRLTPFLIVRFLQILKNIVRKGLKKNYYKVKENLNNRVKGKILVGQHIKQNIFKNRFTATFCEYQQFGYDHAENRFLKKVLQFATSYVENNNDLFGSTYHDMLHTIDFCRSAFELISDKVSDYELKHIKHNPFYKEYDDALIIGNYILKLFAYNITQTSNKEIATPPFWIDMPRLFELYVYSQMVAANPIDCKQIHFQFKTYGNALDILVSKSNFQMIIDAKYKLHYESGQIHEDIRQVSGYSRLKKVREKLEMKNDDDSHINCLIIYPNMKDGIVNLSFENIRANLKELPAYYKVYKLGVKLPFI
ncbi:5-methylcytosine restriction system specificity protein McrC [Flavobacterium sp. RNTU_13]|uniref:5-methylcytosine restriction system specificity protein McrC n=1 Tax=Flavobacterium sp. RNTU_13 TaxID=3375145 RepID=UPI003986C416